MQQVVEMARITGHLVYHTYDSRKSEPGFPDLCIVGRNRERPLFVELKLDKGKLTRAQLKWAAVLKLTPGADYRIWRPKDWPEIEAELGRRRR